MVDDVLSRLSIGSITHVEEEKCELDKIYTYLHILESYLWIPHKEE